MIDPVQAVSLLVSAGFLVLVLELVRRHMLLEEFGLVWILAAAGLIVLSLNRELLTSAAHWLGVYYPPAVLLLALVFLFSLSSLFFSVVISRHQTRLDHLVEELAIVSGKLRELEERGQERAP